MIKTYTFKRKSGKVCKAKRVFTGKSNLSIKEKGYKNRKGGQ